jgi:NitT/TauT family transport system substrate-binding protein
MDGFHRSARIAAAGMLAAMVLASTMPVAAQDDPFGPPEKERLVVAIPFPDIVMYGRYYIADAEGYLGEEGIELEVVTADDPVAAVISGSADIGVQSAGAAVIAANEGLPMDIVGSHSCRQSFNFAVQPDVTAAADLAGKDIVLAGTAGDPAQFEREKVLSEAGWDVSDVGANVVYPGPDSATWREFFLAGSVAMMPYYEDDLVQLQEYGASFPISELKAWPNDVYVASSDWIAENPNALGRFLRAVMRATQFLHAPAQGEIPANKERILEIYQANEVDTTNQAANPTAYALGGHNYCDNLYYDESAWDTTIEGQGLDISLPFAEGADLTALQAAQQSLGLANDPPADIPWPG